MAPTHFRTRDGSTNDFKPNSFSSKILQGLNQFVGTEKSSRKHTSRRAIKLKTKGIDLSHQYNTIRRNNEFIWPSLPPFFDEICSARKSLFHRKVATRHPNYSLICVISRDLAIGFGRRPRRSIYLIELRRHISTNIVYLILQQNYGLLLTPYKFDWLFQTVVCTVIIVLLVLNLLKSSFYACDCIDFH